MSDKKQTHAERIAARRSVLPPTHRLSPDYDPEAFAKAREKAEKPAAGAEPQSPAASRDELYGYSVNDLKGKTRDELIALPRIGEARADEIVKIGRREKW